MPSERGADSALRCSFCGKSQGEVKTLIAGAAVYICNECVAVCNEVLVEDGTTGEAEPPRETYVGGFTCPKCRNTFVLHFQQIHDPEP